TARTVDKDGTIESPPKSLTISINKQYANVTVHDDTGGTVENAVQQVRIDVPVGALPTSSASIIVEPSQQSFAPQVYGDSTPIGQPYDFGPIGMQFETAVNVTMPSDCSDEGRFWYQCIGEYIDGQWSCVVQCDWDNDPPSADRPWCEEIDVTPSGCVTSSDCGGKGYCNAGTCTPRKNYYDLANCRLTAEVTHFSLYQVLQQTRGCTIAITEEGNH
ncbi:MAG: hypothetical protein QW112_01850, partial [Candidatus Micrarchaeia archaeon]